MAGTKQIYHTIRGPDNQGRVYEGYSNANVPTMYSLSTHARTITLRTLPKDKLVRRQVKISDSLVKYHFQPDCGEARRRVSTAGGSPHRPNWVLG